MATPILTFTFEYDIEDSSKLNFTDTTEYDEDIVVTNRSWTIEKPDGTIDEVFPISINSRTATYTLDGDYALKVTMHINKVLNTLGISKTINLLAAKKLQGAIYDLEKNLIDNTADLNDKQMREFLFELKLAGYYLKSAIRLISTDVVGSQKALDYGNNQSVICNCK